VPADRVTEVLGVAEEIHAAEDAIRAAIEAGATLRQARADFNYHSLQTKR
jgi:regulator of RNase E activity RraA